MVLKNTIFNLTLNFYAIESRDEKGLKIDSITHSANIFFSPIFTHGVEIFLVPRLDKRNQE